MNKNKILPLVCAVLLLGAIMITVYFKGVENKISKEKVINKEQNIENKAEEKVEIIDQEQETIVDSQDGSGSTEFVEIDGLETIEEDSVNNKTEGDVEATSSLDENEEKSTD